MEKRKFILQTTGTSWIAQRAQYLEAAQHNLGDLCEIFEILAVKSQHPYRNVY